MLPSLRGCEKRDEPLYAVERRRGERDDRVVVISLTDAGRALQERAKDVPLNVAGCIKLPQEKAQMLYELLYELLNKQTEERKK